MSFIWNTFFLKIKIKSESLAMEK